MKLSDTKNPKTGQPFSKEQMTQGGKKFGLSWKKDNSADPELADALVQAVSELGWDHPAKTMRRASEIQSSVQAQRKQHPKVSWYNNSVMIDGKVNSKLFPRIAIDVLRKHAIKMDGDAFHGRAIGDVPDSVIKDIIARSAKPPLQQKMGRTQVWDGDKPSYI